MNRAGRGRHGANVSLRAVGAVTAGALAVTAIIEGIHRIACSEADVSSWLIRSTGLAHSRAVGTAVIYEMHGRWIGFAITGGCSVALLMVPPIVLTAILVGVDRVSWVRGLVASASAIVLLGAVNQLRLFIIASAMDWWGFQTGYERSHVLIGSAVTTIGLALVTIGFLALLSRRPATRRGRRPSHAV